MADNRQISTEQAPQNPDREEQIAALPATFRSLKEIAGKIDPEKAKPILQQLRAAQKRFEDTYLNLAVIGEFSCGKSTFINALFGRDVLATSMAPTTAVPTYLRWDGEGDGFDVTAYSKTKTYALTDPEARARFEKAFRVRLPEQTERIIDAVTTDNKLDGRLTRVEVVAPRNERMRGICLIDTPGVNPGMEGTAEHVRKTQEVLRDAADAAIIMFPAERIYTADFKRFIEENMSHLLNHSIFVITQCDRIRDRASLDSIVEFAAGQLAISGVKDPVIHCISAACALDVYTGTDSSSEATDWCRRFEETTQEIFGSLADRRNEIVHSNIVALVRQITKAVTEGLRIREQALKESRQSIEALSPARMNEEIEAIRKDFIDKIKDEKEQLCTSTVDVVTDAITRCKSRHYAVINSYHDKEAITNHLKYHTKEDTKELDEAARKHIGRYSNYLKKQFSAYRERIIACVSRYMEDITSDRVNIQVDGDVEVALSGAEMNTSGFMTPGRMLEESKDFVDDIFYNSDNVFEGAIKAALGLAALPFVVIGSAFNWLRSIDSIKTTAKQRIDEQLNNNRQPLCQALIDGMGKLFASYCDASKKLPEGIAEQFSALYAETTARYESQSQAVERQLKSMRSCVTKLRRIKALYGVGAFPKQDGA